MTWRRSRAPYRPVHAPGFGDLDHVRRGTHDGHTRLGRGRLIVSDIEAAYGGLVGRGIDVSDVWHGPPFPLEARQPGPDPERTSYGSFFSFNDPDGNTWLVQEVTTRLPGRIDPRDRRSRPRRIWRRTSAGRRHHVEHRRDGPVAPFTGRVKTTTGPPGMPPTWWRSGRG